jgi:hypothetical protein
MKLLDLSSESVYRRIRGEIAFTLEEISKLSAEMNFSLDHVLGIGQEDNHLRFGSFANTLEGKPEMFVSTLQMYIDLAIKWNKAQHIESLLMLNSLPIILITEYDHLFKFFYYKWLHQTSEVSLTCRFSEVEIPEDIVRLKEILNEPVHRKGKNAVILDRNIFLDLIGEVQYYHMRNLITGDDIALIRDDLTDLATQLEKWAQIGVLKDDRQSFIYLSSLNVMSNSAYINVDGELSSYFSMVSSRPLITTNVEICERLKRAFMITKKYSVLITQSNELLQSQFFTQQREFIKGMGSKDFIHL